MKLLFTNEDFMVGNLLLKPCYVLDRSLVSRNVVNWSVFFENFRHYKEYGNRKIVINVVCVSGIENWCCNDKFPNDGKLSETRDVLITIR